MAHSILSALLVLGLLASGDVCTWLCAGASAKAAVQVEVDSHCGGGSAPEPASDEPRSHDDCPGCGLDLAAHSVALDQPVTGFAALPVLRPEWRLRDRSVLRRPLAPPRAQRWPPRDILALTTTLQV
jgi:hypothetical protein